MAKLIVRTALILAAVATLSAAPQQHNRLFPPEQLGTLEGPDRDAWQRPDQVMDTLLIAEGSVVADLGAGGGWFTMRLASRVGPNGIVYAEDVQPQMIEAITRRTSRAMLRNVRTVRGTSSDPRLPAPVDAVLIVDTYHDLELLPDGSVQMEQPVVMLGNVARSLKPAGRIGQRGFMHIHSKSPGVEVTGDCANGDFRRRLPITHDASFDDCGRNAMPVA